MVIAVLLFFKVYREAVLLAFQVVRVGCKGCLRVLLVTRHQHPQETALVNMRI